MPKQVLTTKPARHGCARPVQIQSRRPQSKLPTACQNAFRPLKHRFLGIKSDCSPINTCASSYEINSIFGLITQAYSYDAKGQRTAKTTLNNNGINNGTGTSETPMSATFDSANRMTGISLNMAGATKTYALSYDSNGNLTQKQNSADAADKTTYAWDTSNRLTQLTQTGATAANSNNDRIDASFSYDAFGRRIQSTIAKGGQAANTVQYLRIN